MFSRWFKPKNNTVWLQPIEFNIPVKIVCDYTYPNSSVMIVFTDKDKLNCVWCNCAKSQLSVDLPCKTCACNQNEQCTARIGINCELGTHVELNKLNKYHRQAILSSVHLQPYIKE